MHSQDSQPEAVRGRPGDVTETHDSPNSGGPEPAAPPERLGDFRILRVIGSGGMGVVYEAEQVSLGRRVALKLLPRALHRDAVSKARFEREARAAAKLHHSNIVPVFGVGEHEGLPYYVMQLIAGRGLDVVLAEQRRTPGPHGPPTLAEAHLAQPKTADPGATVTMHSPPGGTTPPPALAARPESALPHASQLSSGGFSPSGVRRFNYWQGVARIGAQAADALDYAHRQGILHRDIKPSNLLLDEQGTVWVADFGLAKSDDSDNLTEAGDIIGTLRYLPPEAFEGQTDRRTDVYGLGLTLYELLALKPAFAEMDRKRIIKQVMTTEPQRLDQINPAIPRDLVTIVHKAADRDPARRYQTAGDLAADLQRFLDDEPIRARRQTQVERYMRWARRHPGIAVLGALLTVVLVLGTVASLLAAGYFNRLRLSANQSAQNERGARQVAERAGAAERWERYRSNIAAASAALQLQKSETAKRALEAAPEEHRNWEWQYLHNQLDGASRVLSLAGIETDYQTRPLFALSPDGRQIAAASTDRTIALWDVNSIASRPAQILRGHTRQIVHLAFSPDGRQLATSSQDSIRLWDPTTGKQTFVLPTEGKPTLSFSSDSKRLLSTEDIGKFRLWDPATGKLIGVVGDGPFSEAHQGAAFSPDGRRVAAVAGKDVRVYDAVTGRQLASCGPHEWVVEQVYFCPDGKRILANKYDGAGPNSMYLWDAETGKLVAKLIDHQTSINQVLFNAQGTRFATASMHPENKVRLWDAATGELLHTLSGHLNTIRDLSFSPDGARLASSSLDQTARLWDARSGALIAALRGHWSDVHQVMFTHDSKRLVSGSADQTMRLWNAKNGDLIAVLRGHGNAPRGHCTPDGSRLVSSSFDGTVRIWDLNLLERNGVLRGHTSFVYDVVFSADGEQVTSVAWDGTARFWDATTGHSRSAPLKHPNPYVTSLAFSRDYRTFATANTGYGVILWDLAAAQPRLAVPLVPHARVTLSPDGKILACTDYQRSLAVLYDTVAQRELAKLNDPQTPPDLSVSGDPLFSPDGATLVTNAAGGRILIWDVATWKVRGTLPGSSPSPNRFAFSPDSQLLAAAASDQKTLRLWDLRTFEQLAILNVGTQVLGVAFSPDTTRLAAGCRDNTIRLIDVASWQEVGELRGHADYVHAVAWSPDGTRLVSGSGDTTVRIWDSLSMQERAKKERGSLRRTPTPTMPKCTLVHP